jgi:KDO2-lipid IV(A) lauroyltransferase
VAIGRVVGWLWYYVFPVRRAVAKANVRRVFAAQATPQLQRRIVRAAFVNQTWMGLETLRFLHQTRESALAGVRFEGVENYERAHAKGKGVILATAHLGAFVHCIGAIRVADFVRTIIIRRVSSSAARNFELSLFAQFDAQPISSRASADRVREALKRGHGLLIAIDQHVAPYRAVVCSFFGQLVATTPAPARFSLETGAPIIPMRFFRTEVPTRHVITFEPEFLLESPHADPQANLVHNTDRLNRVVERWILAAPEQWLWMHRRWKVHDHPEGWQIPAQFQALQERGATGRAQ